MAFGAYILPMPFVEKLATDLIHLRFQPKFIYYCDHLLRMHKLTWFRQTIIFFIINFYDLCFKWCWCLFILYHSLVIFPRDLFPFSLYHWFLWFVFQLSSDTNACSSFVILLSFSQEICCPFLFIMLVHPLFSCHFPKREASNGLHSAYQSNKVFFLQPIGLNLNGFWGLHSSHAIWRKFSNWFDSSPISTQVHILRWSLIIS